MPRSHPRIHCSTTCRPRCLVTDSTRNERGWVCVRHPGDFHTCTPQQVPNTPQPAVLRDHAPEPSIPAPNNPQWPTNWHHQGPPHQQPGSTNSWLYVPLLLAATGRLTPEAANQWANHESAAGRWAELVAALQAASHGSNFTTSCAPSKHMRPTSHQLNRLSQQGCKLQATRSWTISSFPLLEVVFQTWSPSMGLQ